MTEQTKAQQLIAEHENGSWIVGTKQWCEEAVDELRRLSSDRNPRPRDINVQLMEALLHVWHTTPDDDPVVAAALSAAIADYCSYRGCVHHSPHINYFEVHRIAEACDIDYNRFAAALREYLKTVNNDSVNQ